MQRFPLHISIAAVSPVILSFFAALLLLGSCSRQPGPGEDGNWGGTLELVFPEVEGLSSAVAGKVIVNGKTLEVVMKDGRAFVDAEPSADGTYEVLWPASSYSRLAGTFVLVPGQASAADGLSSWTNFPCKGLGGVQAGGASADGVPDSGKATVTMKALSAFAQVRLSSGAALRSLHLEDMDGGVLSATYLYEDGTLVLKEDEPLVPSTTFIAGPDGSGAGVLALCVPPGSHARLQVRATDVRGRCAEVILNGVNFESGRVCDLGTLDFSLSADILYAQHFDSCVWGGDPIEGKPGYGPEYGTAVPAGQMRRADAPALFPKDASTPGTELLRSEVWDSRLWNMSEDYLRQSGLASFDEAFYTCAYRGYIGGNPSLGFSNRPVIYLPLDMDIDSPRSCEVSFRLCAGNALGSNVEVFAARALLAGMEVDGKVYDLNLATGNRNVTQRASHYYITALIGPEVLADAAWHTVKLRFDAFSRNAAVRILPSTVRGVDNVIYIDDIVVRDCSRTNMWPEALVPTTAKGSPGGSSAQLRLTPSYASSVSNSDFYTVWPKMGMTWVAGSLPLDEAKWEDTMSRAMALYDAAEVKPKFWSIHLPYGNRGTERNRDLCVPDEALHEASVAFYKKAIMTVAPLKPANVLVHCNQTLLFNDGSSADMMVRSLKELAPVADGIGAHLVVENMSYGVGADAAVLAECVDKANEGLNLEHEIRICMDTGHANLYLNTVGDKGTVVDWLRTAGTRIGDLHISANRGFANKVYETSITCYDDHLYPGYDSALTKYYDKIGLDGLWGAFYRVLLEDCLYRGPFVFESSTKTFEADGETRSDHAVSPWQAIAAHENYVYPEFRKELGL